MSSSQFVSSLRAAASVSYVGVGPARIPTFTTFPDGSANVRGFSSIARTGGQVTGVLDLMPDDINGFSPVEDTVEITARHTFNPAIPDNSPRINYEILAPDPVTGKRGIRVYTLMWSQAGGTTALDDIDFDIKIRTTRLGRKTNMSSSQTTSSLRAQCSVDSSPAILPASNRGFLSVSRLAGQPAGVFVLVPDPNNGFSPNEDTITVTPVEAFDAGTPTRYYSAYYQYSAIKPDGHRDLIVVMLRTDAAGAAALSDRGFSVHVDTTKLGESKSCRLVSLLPSSAHSALSFLRAWERLLSTSSIAASEPRRARPASPRAFSILRPTTGTDSIRIRT